MYINTIEYVCAVICNTTHIHVDTHTHTHKREQHTNTIYIIVFIYSSSFFSLHIRLFTYILHTISFYSIIIFLNFMCLVLLLTLFISYMCARALCSIRSDIFFFFINKSKKNCFFLCLILCFVWWNSRSGVNQLDQPRFNPETNDKTGMEKVIKKNWKKIPILFIVTLLIKAKKRKILKKKGRKEKKFCVQIQIDFVHRRRCVCRHRRIFFFYLRSNLFIGNNNFLLIFRFCGSLTVVCSVCVILSHKLNCVIIFNRQHDLLRLFGVCVCTCVHVCVYRYALRESVEKKNTNSLDDKKTTEKSHVMVFM